MRYFDGSAPEALPHGTAWQGVNLKLVDASREILPGVRVVATTSSVPGSMELPELSLSLRAPEGQILVVGCSHPGIETILERSAAAERRVQLLVGGLHLVRTPQPEIDRVAVSLRDRWKVARVAVGHCTSEPGFAALQKTFGGRYVYAGLGTTVPLP
jgi:7,8-dihydropterin-6-yl-methyl-4-(beta-D-ribofuranosyl)aminobenzene 5'-phosphate synthase